MDLSKKVFGSNIDPKIQEYLKKLQEGSFEIQPGDPITHTSLDSKTETYLGDRTPFARMWTAVNVVEVSKNDNKPIGTGNNSVYIVNDNTLNSYEYTELDEMGSLMQEYYGAPSELGNNQFLKPTAGITDVSSRSEGSLGALRRTVVKFVVHNKQDFDQVFLPFFLKPGSFVFVDFGWSDKALELYNPNDFINNTDLEMSSFYEEIYNNDDLIKSGLASTLGGRVIKYDVNVNQNQSFECTLEFVSQNYQLLDNEVSEDNDLKFIFTNVLEDLLLLKYLNSDEEGAKIVKAELSQSYLWKEVSREERSKRIKEFLDVHKSFNTEKVIDDYSKKVGVFYQNITNSKQKDLQFMESLYVSFAVFEDDFLNNYVAYWTNEDGIKVTPDKTANLPKFSSQNTYVRWNENLYNMMKIKPRSIDKPLSFLYPDSWDARETSNKFKPSRDLLGPDGKRDWRGTANDKERQRIPLRELFIRTSIIIEAFNTATNVNDALEKIFDHIFEDSGNLINIRLMKNNDFESSLTFHDVNIETIEKKLDETFVFDITSGKTIVQNVDLKFETPKAGLSSMIAIGGLSEPELFDEFQLMRFNILNAIQTTSETSKVQIRHLPIIGEKPKDSLNYDVDISKVIGTYSAKSPKIESEPLITNFQYRYTLYKNARKKYFEDQNKKIPKSANSGKTQTKLRGDKRYVVTANSERDIELLKAKMYTFGASGENTIAPVLPISLTLEVYGNNFLNIGDYFTINFLPETFKDRVYFQIVGVDHSISTSNWKTTYNTVMRPYSTRKYFQYGVGKNNDLSALAKITFSGILMEEIQNQLMAESGVINEHQRNMIERFELLEGGQGTLDSGDGEIYFKSFLAHYDVNKNKDKLSEFKKKEGGFRYRFISTSGKEPLVETDGQLLWLMAVTNQIFKSIDWIKWNDSLKPSEAIIFSAGDNTITKYNDEGDTRRGHVFVAHQFYKNEKGILFERFLDKIVNRQNWLEAYISNRKRGPLIDSISKFVENKSLVQDSVSSVFPSSTIPRRSDNGSGFQFLAKIDFELKDIPYDENNLDNQFKILKFEDFEDCKYFSVIQLPSAYLDPDITMKKLAEDIWKEYNELKASFFKDISAELEKERDKDKEIQENYEQNATNRITMGVF